MPSKPEGVSKLIVASEHLNRSIELYFRGDSYYAALHLASAAQELLGKFVERTGAISAHHSLVEGAVRISAHLNPGEEASTPKEIRGIINGAKNRVKHMDDEADDFVSFNAEVQAREMIDLAVSEFYQLWGNGADLQLSSELERYNRFRVERP